VGSQPDFLLVVLDNGVKQGEEIGRFFRVILLENFLAESAHQVRVKHESRRQARRGIWVIFAEPSLGGNTVDSLGTGKLGFSLFNATRINEIRCPRQGGRLFRALGACSFSCFRAHGLRRAAAWGQELDGRVARLHTGIVMHTRLLKS
jgi:hypothetical protein